MDNLKPKASSKLFELNNGHAPAAPLQELDPHEIIAMAYRQSPVSQRPQVVVQPVIQEKGAGTGKRWVLAIAVFSLIALGSGGAWVYTHRGSSQLPKPSVAESLNPVPATVMAAVDYKVYYPDTTKLPTGYTLDEHSFNVLVKNGIAYTVSYESGKKIVFSLQTKPADDELASFRSNYIPLRTDFQTPLGQAQIGAYHSQTLVSLPLLDGPWIVITAPPDINQDQLKQVINSLKT